MFALLVLSLMAVVLTIPVIFQAIGRRVGRRPPPRRDILDGYDPGRERRAEQRARRLLRSCVNEEEWAMYRDLGFLRVTGRHLPGGRRARSGDRAAPYAYLIYPNRPLVAYEPATGRLLSEYCVEFPDLGGGRSRLPASDDVLAKWMALTSDESRLVASANMHLVGRQHDPDRLRRDIWRLAEWERRRSERSRAGTAA